MLGMAQVRRAFPIVGAVAMMLIAACGSGGSDDSSASSETEPPTATPSPAPTPEPTPGRVAAVIVRDEGWSSGVNDREWISVRYDAGPAAAYRDSGVLLLPPDAGPDAEPPVALPCGEPTECFHQFDLAQLVAGDLVWGVRVVFGSGGPFFGLPYVFDVEGKADLLVPDLGNPDVYAFDEVVRGPTRVLVGYRAPTRSDPALAAYWTVPTDFEVRPLPFFGSRGAVRPTAIDARDRIAGTVLDPPGPVYWRPDVAGYTLVDLPGLVEGAHGGATAIHASGWIAGWSEDATGRRRPVVWEENASGDFDAHALPEPPGDVSCSAVTTVTAVSRRWAAADCLGRDGYLVPMVWSLEGGVSVPTILEAIDGDDEAHVEAVEGDLAVGWSGTEDDRKAVAWRLRSGNRE